MKRAEMASARVKTGAKMADLVVAESVTAKGAKIANLANLAKGVKILASALLCAALAQNALALDFTLSQDAKETKIGFKATKFGFVGVDGLFKQFDGRLSLGENNEIDALKGVIEIESVFSDSKKRDKHLLEANFLDVEKFKQGTFTMSQYEAKEQKGDKIFGVVKGILSLHGVDKEVELQSELNAGERPTLSLSGKINIKDFGMQGSSMNSDIVEIKIQTTWDKV